MRWIASIALALLVTFSADGGAREWRIAHEREILREFAALLTLPNLASDQENIEHNAAAIVAMLESRDVAARVLQLDGAPPIVIGDLPAPGATRTVAFYAHYDGQPVDESQWRSSPWRPVVRDAAGNDVDWSKVKTIDPEWRLYARSAGDDKAPIVAMMVALDAMREAKTRPRFNLRFVFEGEEEAGSPHLAQYIAKYPDVLRPDAWIICDGPVHQTRRKQLAFGVRGVLALDLTVYGPVKGLHDGHYGNWVPNPIVALAHVITSMRDENGRILIDGFYDDIVPPTDAEKAAIAAMPAMESTLKAEFQIGATEGGLLNERIMLPALNVSGIRAGQVGDDASNTIQPSARAAIDFRLVPAQTTESVKKLVEQHLQSIGYKIVRDDPDAATRTANAKTIKVIWGSGYGPARTSLELPLSREIASIMTAVGHEPLRLPTMGGSLPIHIFQQNGNTPAIVLPIANHDNNQHAANENLRLQNLWDAIEIFEALFTQLNP